MTAMQRQASIIQDAMKAKTGTATGGEKTRPSKSSRQLRLNFLLKVYDASRGLIMAGNELQAGQCYDVVIICEHSRGTQEETIVTGDFDLSIIGKYSGNTGHGAPYGKLRVSYSAVCQNPWHEECYNISLPEDLPTCELEISLMLQEETWRYPKEDIASRRLPIKGNVVLEDRELLETCNIVIGLPENTAVLNIMQESGKIESNKLEIRCHNRRTGDQRIVLPGFPVGIAQSYPDQNVSTILRKMSDFSLQHAGELANWLRSLYEACQKLQKQACVIIVNTTEKECEFPWELLEIGVNEYLGAVAQIVRWYPFKPYGRPKMLEVKEWVYEGKVLYYLDDGLKAVEQERDALEWFECEQLSDLHALKKRLLKAKKLEQMGLVYIGCHGKNSNELIGETGEKEHREMLQRPNQTLRSLELVKMSLHEEPRPIFFINACDSARLVRSDKARPSSFAASFLVQCASNYIGTVTPVGMYRASTIGRCILELARTAKGVLIAEALRILREKAVERMKESEDGEEDLCEKDLFYTFMYVYYGNPLAWLKLREKQREEDGTNREKEAGISLLEPIDCNGREHE